MTLHDRIKAILSDILPQGTTIAEVFLPFDSRTSAYRVNTPAVVFRIEEMIESFGLWRLTLRIDMLGKTTDVEGFYKAICSMFSVQVNDENWSLSLASGSLRESWDTDLNIDWGTMMLKGIAIEQGV